MATDQLTIGGFTLSGFATPDTIGAGGKQAMHIHKLPGGSRVIDTLGPDEDDITLSGQFFANDALATCTAIDAMRAAGSEVPLIFAGQYRSVVVEHFAWRIRKHPIWVEYSISMVVASNPSFGILGAIGSTIDQLVGADLSAMLSF